MKRAAPPPKQFRAWRLVATFSLIAVLLVALARHHQLLRQAITVATNAQVNWLLAGLCATILTFMMAAGVYRLLGLHPLRYGRTVLVELAASFANRLLPAGLGGLGLHGIYLHHQKHTVAESTAVVSINNALGIAAHLSLLAVVGIVRPELFATFAHRWRAVHWGYIVTGLASVALVVVIIPAVRRRTQGFFRNLCASLRRLQPAQVGAAYGVAIVLTLCYTAALYCSLRAVGLHLSLLQTFIVFSIGMLAGTATPTPGGLVGIEAGLYAGLVGYGAQSAVAAAGVLMYRVLTYWLPLLPGAAALFIARQRKVV